MKSTTLYFTAPGRVELREEMLPEMGPAEVLVESQASAISAGTEMLVYRGQFPRDLKDSNDQVSTDLHYPLCYGYASVGRVTALGKDVDKAWEGRLVFSFRPHCSCYVAFPESLLVVPESLPVMSAVFLPNMETAVNLVQDAEPLLGECALVLGQGIVGLLTASLLHEFPVQRLVTADRYELRRKASLGISVDASLDPTFDDFRVEARKRLPESIPGFDLTLELSGNPSALDDAIALTAFSGRVVVGSWYGEKRVGLDLGGAFHRSRIALISSQVSTISPKLSARWSKSRRFDIAWDALQRLRPEKWITHQFAIGDAPDAYRLLDESPTEALQVVFTYT
jgi:2-desacetyl-2-hydroxyethyl bacteriochlorophyllide A dehydrogenase